MMFFIFFVYGLAFFVMGVLSIFLIRKNSTLRITKFLPYLGAFGIFHGFTEWTDMVLLLPPEALGLANKEFLQLSQAFLLFMSFFCLFQFGYRMYLEGKTGKPKFSLVFLSFLLGGIALFMASGAFRFAHWHTDINIFSRYFLGLAGAVFSGLAMLSASKELKEYGYSHFARNFFWAGILFFIYGLLAGILVPRGALFPSNVINQDLFLNLVGIPVQFFRALITIGLAFHLAIGFRVYDEEERQRLYSKSVTDELTGLYNHRFFQERLEEELARSQRQNLQTSLIMLDIDHFKVYNDTQGHPTGDILLRDLADIMKRNLREMDIVARYGGEEFAVILPNAGSHQAFEVAERIRQEVEDFPFIGKELQPGGKVTISLGIATFPTDSQDKGNLIKLADLALYKAKEKRNQVEIYFSVLDDLKGELDYSELGIINTVKTLITVINAVDHYTYGHSERVVNYAERIAQKLGLPDKEIKLIKYGAFLHDIGKIEIDRNLLCKTGTLSVAEKLAIRQHPNLGAEIIRPIKPLRQVVPYILYHQEHYDGNGYPEGLKGEGIPLGARIVAVADSYDAMITSRPYKQGRTPQGALQELRKHTGTQFDPTVVEAFISILEG